MTAPGQAGVPAVDPGQLAELLGYLTPEERRLFDSVVAQAAKTQTPRARLAAHGITAQPGPQEQFLRTAADIAIYGGSAGSGKSWALLLDPDDDLDNPRFGGVIFRRTSPQIRNEGGLWDESGKLYPLLGAEPRETTLEWRFPSGATMRFAHMEHEKNRLDWQGSQIPWIGFDELTHFTEAQFFYMLSRNRSMDVRRLRIRATTNPDADSWVADFIAWWIDRETGLPIPERSGVLRWFIRLRGELLWADDPAELRAMDPASEPKSVTFIPAKIHDNARLLAANPGYLANLKALPLVEQARLLDGNWKIRPDAGLVFNRAWFKLVDAAPQGPGTRYVRYWDKAGTAGGGDWTVGALLCLTADKLVYVIDVERGQWGAGERERVIAQKADADRQAFGAVDVWVEQEPGSGGKESAENTIRNLQGFAVYADPVGKSRENKVQRANPLASQAQAGNVHVLKRPWTEGYLRELHAFPTEGVPDDQVDASSGAYNRLADSRPFFIV